MTLAELVEEKTEALRVQDVARMLDVSTKQIYKMAAKGQIPSLRIANTVRFDPQEFAFWLRTKASVNPIKAGKETLVTHAKSGSRSA